MGENVHDRPEIQHPSKPNHKPLFTAVVVAFNLFVVFGLFGVVRYLYPNSGAFRGGMNPVVLSQNDSERPSRLRHLELTFMPYTGFHHPPNVAEQGYFGGVRFFFRTNNRGFLTPKDFFPFQARGGESKGVNDRVVFLTGGSAAYGWGATSNETTIAYVLEDLLNENDSAHRWQVINFAMGSWIAYQEYLALDLYGSAFFPDWVITFDGRNDLLVPTVSGEKVPNYYYYTAQKRLNGAFEEGARASFWNIPFFRHRALARKMDEVAQPPEPVETLEEIRNAARFYIHSLELIARRFPESQVLFVTQPTTHYLSPSLHRMNVRVMRRGYNEIIPLVADLPRTHPNTRHLDATRVFSKNLDQYFVDDCHLRDKGQEVIARLMAESILGRHELKPARPRLTSPRKGT